MKSHKISLLGTGDTGEVGKDASESLSIPRLMRPLGGEGAEVSFFLENLRHPPLSVEEIRGRQAVIATFVSHPSMLRELLVLFDEFGRIKGNWDAERSKSFTLRRLNTGDATTEFYNARLSLQLNARYLKITLLRLQAIAQLLAKYRHESAFLLDLQNAAHAASLSPAAQELYAFADQIEGSILEAVSYDMEAESDDEVRLIHLFLSDFRHTSLSAEKESAESGTLASFFRRASRQKSAPAPLPPEELSAYMTPSADLRHALRMEAIGETDRRITHAARALLSRFGDVRRDLYFYQRAISYCTRMAERGISMIYPEILPEDACVIRIKELRDPLLLSESSRTDAVVANDMDLCRAGGISGMLIRGANSSGKTVFLRSVGTAVLFALNGLPIPAASAEISVRRSMHTLFASAEKELSTASSAGRFEEEAAAMAQILDSVSQSSLILLNETFQSTAYAEGAAGIAPILEHISLLGGSFIFVTHLTELFDTYRNTPGVRLAVSGSDPRTRYKILPDTVKE